MPIYKWEARTRVGENKRGTMEAPNQQAVMLRLRQQGMTPSNIGEVTSLLGRLSAIDLNISPGGGSVKRKSLVMFTRQFATMIDAGLPLVQGIEILAGQSDDKVLQKVLYQVKADVESGSTLSGAMGKHPAVFDTLYVALVSAGEMGGILDTILDRLASYLEATDKLVGRVKSATMYPIIILIVFVVVVAAMMEFIVPAFAKMFKNLGNAELPGPTKLVMHLSDLFRNYTPHMIAGIIAFVVLYKMAMKVPKLLYAKDFIMINIPILGPVIRKSAVARFTRTLGTMISSGVPILQALDTVEKTAGNKVVEKGIAHVKDRISEGKSMAEPLLATGIFPVLVVQMIAVGESTGALDSMLAKISDFYDEEVNTAVEGLTSMIEPLMMVALGPLVGFLLIAMYLPIFSLATVM